MQYDLQKKVDHLARVLKQNGYPANVIRNASAPPTQEAADTTSRDEEQEEERGPLVVIPYVAGLSEDVRCICRKFNIRVVFKSRRTLHSMLIHYLLVSSPMLYIVSPAAAARSTSGKTRQRLETRLKEH